MYIYKSNALCNLLAFRDDGKLTVDEFISGCSNLKGTARSLELARLGLSHGMTDAGPQKLLRTMIDRQSQQSIEAMTWQQ